MLTRWLLYPYAHTLYCTKYHKIPVNGYTKLNRLGFRLRPVTKCKPQKS
jgi:hypothetical protein